MLKRTKGRLLLTLLVVTGFAGTLNDNTLTKGERKFIVSQLKSTKTDLVSTVKDLSEAQLNYKQSAESWSIKESVSHLTLAEKRWWRLLEMAMKEPANPEKRARLKLSDEGLIETLKKNNAEMLSPASFDPSKANSESINEALSAFRISRLQYLKYAKTTTEDLRNHFIQMPFGWIDCYQFFIFLAMHSDGHAERINKLIRQPGFPKK